MPLFALLQTASDVSPLISLGVGGGIAALVITMWRQDRKDSQERFEKLAADFRQLIQDNTRAMTILAEKLDASDKCAAAELLVEIIRKGKPVNLEP